MTIWTRTSAAALAAALFAGSGLTPALAMEASEAREGIHQDQKAEPGLDQPYVPGYNQSPEANVRGMGEPSVGEPEQQANRLSDEPEVIGREASWEQHEDYVSAAGEAMDFWKDKVEDVNPRTVRLDTLEEQFAALEEQHQSLKEADAQSWDQERQSFEEALLTVRDTYAALPQQRKSEATDPDASGAGGGDSSQTTD